jgi:hypothetical protein
MDPSAIGSYRRGVDRAHRQVEEACCIERTGRRAEQGDEAGAKAQLPR